MPCKGNKGDPINLMPVYNYQLSFIVKAQFEAEMGKYDLYFKY